MNLDFAFRDDGGRIVLSGWTYQQEPELAVQSGEVERPAEVIARFPRADLGPMPLGLLAVAKDVPADDAEAATSLVGPVEIDLGPFLAAGDEPLVNQALDETVEALLRAIALGQVGGLSPGASAALLGRVRATARHIPLEQPRLAIGVDQAMLAASGLGFVNGWTISDSDTPDPALGLVLDGRGVTPLTIAAGALRRPDLLAFGRRYHVSGQDGFAAAFRASPGGGGRDGYLVMLSADPDRLHGFGGRSIDLVSEDRVAEQILAALELMPAGVSRATLLRSIAAPRGQQIGDRPALPAVGARAIGNGTVIALIADTEPAELRDVLRQVVPAYDWPVEVRIVGETTSPAVAAAVEVAAAELADMQAQPDAEAPSGDLPHLTLGDPLGLDSLADLTLRPGVTVVYGWASAMAQLGLPSAMPDGAEALVHDPLAGLGDDRGPGPADLIASPLIVAMPGAMFTAMLAGQRARALTPAGLIGAGLATLLAAGRMNVRRVGATVWPGNGGPAAATRIDAALAELDA